MAELEEVFYDVKEDKDEEDIFYDVIDGEEESNNRLNNLGDKIDGAPSKNLEFQSSTKQTLKEYLNSVFKWKNTKRAVTKTIIDSAYCLLIFRVCFIPLVNASIQDNSCNEFKCNNFQYDLICNLYSRDQYRDFKTSTFSYLYTIGKIFSLTGWRCRLFTSDCYNDPVIKENKIFKDALTYFFRISDRYGLEEAKYFCYHHLFLELGNYISITKEAREWFCNPRERRRHYVMENDQKLPPCPDTIRWSLLYECVKFAGIDVSNFTISKVCGVSEAVFGGTVTTEGWYKIGPLEPLRL